MRMQARTFFSFVALLLLGVALLSLSYSAYRQQAAGSSVTIDLSTPEMTSQFSTGATHTQNDNVSYTTSGKQLLQSALVYQNVFMMGWGSENPEPSPGSYDWGDLDARVQHMRDTGATMMISLCCAPDWMKGGQPGETDWSKLTDAPLPDNYADFAELAKQVALRYRDVKYFQVWDEMKGFWSDSLNRWNYEGYTQMYNAVYDAIKSVRPDAKIGGPYVNIASSATYPTSMPAERSLDQSALAVLSYWLSHKHGADFIVVDGGPGPRDDVLNSGVTNEFAAGQFYADAANWIRKQPGGETLPIGWAEWYPGSSHDWNELDHFNAVMANDMIYTLKSGAFYAFPWGTQGDSSGFNLPETIMTSQGQPTPQYYTLKAFKDYFGPGTELYKATSSSPDITVLASSAKTMLVNHLGSSQTVNVNSIQVTLQPFQVLVIDTPA